MNRRMERVNGLLRIEISRVLASELKDPRLSQMITITRVDTSSDLKNARAYVSVLGTKTEKQRTLKTLRSASGFVSRTMRSQMTLKVVPLVEFLIDDSIEQGDQILKLMNRVSPVTKDTKSSP